jgi:hypothetical protein
VRRDASPLSHGYRLVARVPPFRFVKEKRFWFGREGLNGDVVEMSEPCVSPRRPQSAIPAAVKPDLDPTRSNEVRKRRGEVAVVRNVDSRKIEASRLLSPVALALLSFDWV